MTLAAVRTGRDPDGNTVVSRDGNVMVEALRVHWSAVFKGGEVDRVEGRKILDPFVSSFDSTGIPPPCVADYTRAIRAAKAWSAPGPDGIPFGAWGVL